MPPPSLKLDLLAALPGPEIARVTRRGKSGTVPHLSEQFALHKVSIRRYLRMLHAEKLAHIGAWNRTTSNFEAVWVQGAGQHAPQPDKLSDRARARRYLARIRKAVERSKRGFQYDERYESHVARAKAREAAQQVVLRARANPQQWYSALGL